MKKLLQFLIINTTIMMISCQKDDSGDMTIPGSTNSAQINATISGRVTDESGASLQGVNIIAYGNSASTDANGIFLIKGNVAKERCVLEFNKAGYMKRLHAIIASSSKVNYVNIVLQNEPIAQSFQSASGGSVTLDHGGSVTFPANAFVIDGTTNSYSGLVIIKAKHISPDNSNFSMLIPGGDLSAVDANGDNVSLYSYGMAGVTITGSGGENLQLATGSTAIINFPIAATQTSTAPQTIPLWYLDERDGLWKEEGAATRIGNNYVGYVEHFTWWNCDYQGLRATINGRVVDCEGTPLANVIVTVNGQLTVVTDQNGYYTNWVPAGMMHSFQVLPQGVIILASQTESGGPLLTGQNFTVPDLVVPCGAKISGHLNGCNGEQVSGNILLKVNNEIVNHLFTLDGTFNITGIENSIINLMAVSGSGTVLQQVTTSNQNSTTDIGTLILCSTNVLGSNSFKLTGGGYQNLPVIITNYTANYGYGYLDRSTCGLTGSSSTFGNGCSITIEFPGSTTISQDLSDSTLQGFDFQIYLPQYGTLRPAKGIDNHFLFDVTEYGNVGDSIKGTFYGDMRLDYGVEIIYVNDGHFAFLRSL